LYKYDGKTGKTTTITAESLYRFNGYTVSDEFKGEWFYAMVEQWSVIDVTENRIIFTWRDYNAIRNERNPGLDTPIKNTRIKKHDFKTNETTDLVKELSEFRGSANGYFSYDDESGTTCLYSMEKDKFYKISSPVVGTLFAVEGDLAFFSGASADTFAKGVRTDNAVTVCNIKMGKVLFCKSGVSADRFSGSWRFIGKYNGKVYFHDTADLFCYDVGKKTFKKLKRPADIKEPKTVERDGYTTFTNGCWFDKVEIVKSGGKTYLKWTLEIINKDGTIDARQIVKKREIK
jgi:hypothetical protein